MNVLAQRVEMALAASSATLLSAHAQLGLAAVTRLSSWLPAWKAIQLYCEAQDLSSMEAEWVRLHVLARGDQIGYMRGDGVAVHGGRMTRVWLMLREHMRIRFAPAGDPALRELLIHEYAHARAILLKVHVRNAVRLAAAVGPELSGPAAVALYADRMHIPSDIIGAVYALAVDQLREVRYAAMLPAPRLPAPTGGSGYRQEASYAAPASDRAAAGEVVGP